MYVYLSVCPSDILIFYFSAIRRDVDLKCIQDTYSVVLNSLKIIDHRRSMSQGRSSTLFSKMQSYHKN